MRQWKHNPDVVLREEDDGRYLAFNLSTGSGMIVNATSYFIWREAGTGQDDESIARELPKRFAFSGAPPSANELREIVSNHLLLLQQVKVLEEACPGDAADPVEAL